MAKQTAMTHLQLKKRIGSPERISIPSEHQQYVPPFQLQQARNPCRADQTSINPRKIQSEFSIKWNPPQWLTRQGLWIPAYEKNRTLQAKSVVSFYRDSILRLSVFHRPLMLWPNLPVADIIHLQSNKFVTGVKTKATGDSKLNDCPWFCCYYSRLTLPAI